MSYGDPGRGLLARRRHAGGCQRRYRTGGRAVFARGAAGLSCLPIACMHTNAIHALKTLRTTPWGAMTMAILTVRNLPDEVHRALRVRAAQRGHSVEAEVRENLAFAVSPQGRVTLGSLLPDLTCAATARTTWPCCGPGTAASRSPARRRPAAGPPHIGQMLQ